MNKMKCIQDEQLKLEEIQQASFVVLKKVVDICEQQKIKYYLAYGTLLGAVRHKGFVPWDDDVDIIMPRVDFERFIYFMKTNYSGTLVVCDRQTTQNYPYGIPRVCDMRYKYVSTSQVEPKFDQGVFVDVYPMDNCCDNKVQAYKLFESVQKRNLMYLIYVGCGSIDPIKRFLKKIIRVVLRIIKGTEWSQKIDKEIYAYIRSKTSDANSSLAVTAWANNHVVYDKSWFENDCFLEFNGEMFRCPANYTEVLRESYGDFMELPPEDKRKPHHDYVIYKRK